jgi:filamentous hemagglutinin family protein
VLASIAGLAVSSVANAQPQGTRVERGDASITRSGSLTQIRAANNTILRHASFDIAQGQTVQFIQPSANARVLNRIDSAAPTRIDGALLANGRVYLVNPAGVFFGNNSVVNAGGLIAAAGKMSDRDFLRGVDRFTELTGDVIASGSIRAGDVILAGSNVEVGGAIVADRRAILVSGDDVLVRQSGSSSVHVKVGTVSGGLTRERGAKSLGAGDALGHQLNVTGSVRARGIHAESVGTTTLTGALDASGVATGRARGGDINLLGERVTLSGASIDSSGERGGGAVNIGGAFQGQGELRTSQRTAVDASTTITSSASTQGNAGQVVVWSDDHTTFAGTIQAKGGREGGDGALVEVSGKQTLAYTGSTRAGAEKGRNGTLLLDPKNITISAAGFQGVSQSFATNPGSSSQVDLAILLSTLAGNTNVTLQANNDINWQDGETSFFNSTATLTLQAGRSVLIDNLSNGFTKINASGVNINIIANDSVGVLGAGTQANRDAGPGNVTTGNISPGGNVSILVRPTSGAFEAGTVTLRNVTASSLSINTGGSLVQQQSGSFLTVPDVILRSPTGSDTTFNLTRIGNDINNFAADVNGVINLYATGDLRFDALDGLTGVTSTGPVNIILAGNLSQTHRIVAPSLAVETRIDGVGTAIGLGNVDNDLDSVALDSLDANGLAASARSIIYRDIDDVVIDGATTSGTFSLTASGQISQSLPIVATTGLFVTTRNNSGAAIVLNTQANTANNVGLQVLNAVGNIAVNANARYRSLGAMSISDSATGGLLAFTAGGAVTQSGAINANQLSVRTLSNGGANITLAGTNNAPTVSLDTRNAADTADAPGTIAYVGGGTTNLGSLRTTASATLTISGALTQSGALVADALNVNTLSTGTGNIALNNASNNVNSLNLATRDLGNAAQLTDATIAFYDTDGFTIESLLTLDDALLFQGGGSTVTQSLNSDLRVAGLALAQGNWTLTNTGNVFSRLAAANTVSLNVFNSNPSGTIIGDAASSSSFVASNFARIVTRGSLTQTMPVQLGHLIARTLGGGAITLDNADNDAMQLTLESRNLNNTAFDEGPLTYRDTNGFSLLRLGTTGLATFTAGGAANQTGANSPLLASGLLLLGSAGNYTFDRTDNAFSNLAGNTQSANVFSTQPLTVAELGSTQGFAASGFLRMLSAAGIFQTRPITTDLLVVRTLSNAGGEIVLENLGNNIARLNAQTRNAANSDFAPGPIIYNDASGFSVLSLGTTGFASLFGAGAVNQTGAVAPITVAGLQTLGTADYTLDNQLNSIPLYSGTANAINLFTITPLNIGPIFSSNGVVASTFARLQSRGNITQQGPILTPLLVVRTLSDSFTQTLLTNQSNDVNQINMQSRNAANTGFGGGRIVFADADGYSIVSLGTSEQAILRANSGVVNQTGALLPISVGQGVRLFGNGTFNLTNTNNSIPALAGNSGSVNIFTTTGLFITQLGSASGFASTGNVQLTARGPITQDRFLRGSQLVAKTLNDAGADIILITPGNQFVGVVLQARNAADTAPVDATLRYQQN